MSRIAAALCLLSLFIHPAAAQEPPQASPEKCHFQGLEAAHKDSPQDAEEATLIKATNGKVARFHNILSIRPSANFKQAFVDNLPDEEPCGHYPDIETYPERYYFKGLYGDVAVVSFSGYEYLAHFMVDMITGTRYRVNGEDLIASPDRRFLLIDENAYVVSSPTLRILDTKGGLRMAVFPDYAMADMVWDGPHRLKLSLIRPYRKDAVEATVDLDDIGISLSIPTESRTLTAKFVPIPTSDDPPFGPPTKEAK